jgi:LmbE family N-acetylglucosaminyl deacetylase
MDVLGLASLPSNNPERNPDWAVVKKWIEWVVDDLNPDLIFGPMDEVGGHEQHNQIAVLVDEVALGRGIDTVWYMTYRRGDRRSRGTVEVAPGLGHAALKLQAMACYASQIEWVQTRPWFAADDALREWLA